ncbi:MAG: acyltransferase family protein [Janthinobacterium lividum]
MQNRNALIDNTRGIAIFLVVYGHAIQVSTRDYDFFTNPLFTAIYAFHMPLFVSLSGFLLFQSQRKRQLLELLAGKTKQILIPLLIWSGLFLINDHFIYDTIAQEHPLSILTPGLYVGEVTNTLWFLWSLFVSTVITAFISKWVKDAWWAYAVAVLVVCLLPNRLHFYFIKFVFPYFIGGYLFHKYQQQLKLTTRVSMYLSFILFPVLLLFWRKAAYIYLGGPSFALYPLSSLTVVIYRYAVGLAGIVLAITIVHGFLRGVKAPLLAKLGQYSLGLYLISSLLNGVIAHTINLSHESTLIYSFIFSLAVAIVACAISYGLTVLLSKNSLLNRYLFGGR